MVRAQMLSELEEVVNYKQQTDQPERRGSMRKTWMKRLQGCQLDVEVWQRILQVRALVLSPTDDPVMWIKFANLCRKSDRIIIAEKIINSLLLPERVCLCMQCTCKMLTSRRNFLQTPNSRTQGCTNALPMVVYAHIKCCWAKGQKEQALSSLHDFSAKLSQDIHSDATIRAASDYEGNRRLEEISRLLAHCYLKMGKWQFALREEWDSVRYFHCAVERHFLSRFFAAEHQGRYSVVLSRDTLRPRLVQGVAHVGDGELRRGRIPREPTAR